MPEINVNALKDEDERRAAAFANESYRNFQENKRKGMSDGEALEAAMWAALGAASLAIGPYGPVIVAALKAIFDAMPRASGSPPPPPGEPYFFTMPRTGTTQSGVWYGPMLFMYRERPPDWLIEPSPMFWARRPEQQGPAQYWEHVKAHIPVKDWIDAVERASHEFTLPGTGKTPAWDLPDWSRVAASLVARWPYQPVKPGDKGALLGSMAKAPVAAPPKNVSGLLGRLGGVGAVGSAKPISSKGIEGETKPPDKGSPVLAVLGVGAALGALFLIIRR